MVGMGRSLHMWEGPITYTKYNRIRTVQPTNSRSIMAGSGYVATDL